MLLQAIQLAANPGSVDLNLVIAIATVAAALGGLVGAWVSHRQGKKNEMAQQRTDLQAHVSKEVEAKIGTVLMSLRSLEDDARTRLAQVEAALDERSEHLKATVQERESALREIVEKSAVQAQDIEALLKRATLLIPALEAAEAIPMQLLAEASKAVEPAVKTAFLLRALEHPDSDPKVLELAGDMARQELMNNSLAARLYKRATDLDPEHVSSRAEYLHLLAYRPSERPHARSEIVQLAKAHPNDKTVVNAMVNFFIATGDFQGLLDASMELLACSAEQALLRRNIAVALQELNRPKNEVIDAYEEATVSGDKGDYVNTARPYVRYLIESGDLAKASDVLTQALRLRASSADLHILAGELHFTKREYEHAAASFQWAMKLGDHTHQMIAARMLSDLHVLAQLGLDDGGAVQSVED